MLLEHIRELDREEARQLDEIRRSNQPLCQIFEDILDDRVFKLLGIDRGTYATAFTQIREYWNNVLPGWGLDYVLCSVRQLGTILHSPEDWSEIGCYLADATVQTFGNGSHSFIETAVPSLIDSGLARNKAELREGVEILLQGVNLHEGGEHHFEQVAVLLRRGAINSLDELRKTKIYTPLRKNYMTPLK